MVREMDVQFFLKQRTNLIRYFYSESIKPFEEIQQKIEARVSPFDDPPLGYEGPEPPFLEEWMNAATGIDLVGLSCVSLLSDALKLYFNTLQRRVIGFSFDSHDRQFAKREGFVALYKKSLGEIFNTDWGESGVRFDVIEQVVLARNRGQHGVDLTSYHVTHDPQTLRKYSSPFFATEWEVKEWEEAGGREDSYFAPLLKVTRDALFDAASEIEKLADWIERHMDRAGAWRNRHGN
jgi:hypothetical protein